MKSLVISAILLSFSASFAAEPETYHLKVNSHCEGCFKTLDTAVCQPFKSQLTECRQEVGHMWLKGKNLDMTAIKKAIADAGYKVQSEEKKK